MQTEQTNLGNNRIRLDVTVDAEEFQPYLDATYRKIARELKIPGFRPGKAPKPVIDRVVGKDSVKEQAIHDSLGELVATAIKETDLEIVAPPQVDVSDDADIEGVKFEAVVETRPTPTVTNYEALKVAKPPTEVTTEDVDEQIENLRKRFASLEDVERKAQNGDYVVLDLASTHEGEDFPGLNTSDLLLEVGAEMIVKELDEVLAGAGAGDIVSAQTTLGERFGDHQNKQVDMRATVKSVKERKLPEFNDDFAKTYSEHETTEELQTSLKTKLQELKLVSSDAKVRERIIDAFIDESIQVAIPEGMLEQETLHLAEQFLTGLHLRGIEPQAYLDHEKIDAQELKSRMRPQAERNIKLRLGLEEVASQQKLEVTEAERTERIEEIAKRNDIDPNEVREKLVLRDSIKDLDGDILRTKALDYLVERADVIEEKSA